jgi:carbon monoxide dehydrogenase subunit G
MASIRKEFSIAAGADAVWQALRAVGEVQRCAPGFVTDCRMDGDDARIVTFANGFVTRELIVDLDDRARRLAYSARSERLQHHNASLQVFEEGPARCRVVWTADVLPHAAAATVGAMMEQGAAVMSKTLAGHSRAA